MMSFLPPTRPICRARQQGKCRARPREEGTNRHTRDRQAGAAPCVWAAKCKPPSPVSLDHEKKSHFALSRSRLRLSFLPRIKFDRSIGQQSVTAVSQRGSSRASVELVNAKARPSVRWLSKDSCKTHSSHAGSLAMPHHWW